MLRIGRPFLGWMFLGDRLGDEGVLLVREGVLPQCLNLRMTPWLASVVELRARRRHVVDLLDREIRNHLSCGAVGIYHVASAAVAQRMKPEG